MNIYIYIQRERERERERERSLIKENITRQITLLIILIIVLSIIIIQFGTINNFTRVFKFNQTIIYTIFVYV